MEKRKRPRHCLLGHDYVEEKCKDIECKFKELYKKLEKEKVAKSGQLHHLVHCHHRLPLPPLWPRQPPRRLLRHRFHGDWNY